MKKLGLLLLCASSAFAGTLQTSKDVQFLGTQSFRNYVINPGAEKNVSNVTIGATMSVTRTTTTVIEGDAEFTVDGAATSDTADFTTDTFQLGLSGQNCVASFTYEGDASLYTARARINSSNVASLALSNVTSGTQRVNINFPCGDGASAMVLRIENTGAAGAAFRMDSLYVGLATNLTQVAQAVNIVNARRASSDQNVATTAATGVIFNSESLDAFSEFNTTTGVYTATGTRSLLISSGLQLTNVTSAEVVAMRVFKNGTTSMCSTQNSMASTAPNISLVACQVDVVAGDTIAVQVLSSVDTNYDVSNSVGSYITITSFPTSTQLAVRSDLAAWKVDATIAGANPQLGTVDVAAYTGIENASLTLTNNAGTQNLTAQIPCSTTVAPSGTTCSSGSESVGVAFTPIGSFPQDVLACASFTWEAATGASGVYVTTFQIIETPTNAQTISQEGKSRIQSSNQIHNSTASSSNRVCGNFTFSSPGQKALRLMYEQDVTGTVSNAGIFGDQLATAGQRDIHWEVYPLNQGQPTPILVNSITSNTAGVERLERAELNCDAASSITSQSGTWLTAIGNRSTAACTITVAAGIFSAMPACVFTAKAATVQATSVVMTSATAGTVYGASADYDGYLMCMGPR